MEYIDKHGVKYTDDKKTLIRCPRDFEGEYIIPDGVIEIRAEGFMHCTKLNSVIIPGSVMKIGFSTFEGCTNLYDVTIPSSVTHIGASAFKDSAEIVYISGSVEHIGSDAFSGVYNLISNNPLTETYGAKFLNAYCEDGLVYSDTSKTKLLECPKSAIGVLSNNGAKFIRGSFAVTSVVLPDSITEIGDRAFENCSELSSVTISGSVTSIGRHAFEGCTKLTSVSLPDSVTRLGAAAFKGCSGLQSIRLSNGLKIIGNSAFEDCRELNEIDIPKSVAEISESAFKGCIGLSDVTLQEGLTSIGYQAFLGCKNIFSITIPASAAIIGEDAFRGVCNIILANPSTKNYGARFVNAYIDDEDLDFAYADATKTKLLACSRMSIGPCVPDSVKEIVDGAFEDCESLVSINIPDNVTKIGESAFAGCKNLISVYLPSRLEKIESYTFSDCHNLRSIKIPNSVTEIGDDAFDGCASLTSVYIPNCITQIGADAFRGCTSLTSMRIPNSVYNIGKSAFEDCENLSSIYLPDGLEWIEPYTFSGCVNLANIIIPDSVLEILEGAFKDCSKLSTITIPNRVSKIGGRWDYAYAFEGCTGLKEVHICDLKSWCEISFGGEKSNPLYYAKHLFLNGKELTDLVFPNEVKQIENYSFINCLSLRSATIPFDTDDFEGAFEGCANLTNISIGGRHGIGDVYEKKTIAELYGKQAIDITINEGVEWLDIPALCGFDRLESVSLPSTIKGVGNTEEWKDKNYLPDIEQLHIKDLSNWYDEDSDHSGVAALFTHVEQIYVNDKKVSDLIIPDGVRVIPDEAFACWKDLLSISIPDSVEYIGSNAFASCKNVKSVHLSKNLIEIERGGFYKCAGLTSITLPESITTIGEEAFFGCDQLKEIVVPIGQTKHFREIFKENNNDNLIPLIVEC